MRRKSNHVRLVASVLLGALSLAACGKQEDGNAKLLVSDKIKVASAEFALARAHDFDRACESLYLQVPIRTQLRDVADQAKNAFNEVEDIEATPTTVRRWDYVLVQDRQSPQSYESIFIGEWHPFQRHRASAGTGDALFVPMRCVLTTKTIALFELEPPFVEAAGSGPSQRSASIVAKYSHIPPGVGESVEQRTRKLAHADKANVGETAAISVIIKESDALHSAPAVSGSSSRN